MHFACCLRLPAAAVPDLMLDRAAAGARSPRGTPKASPNRKKAAQHASFGAPAGYGVGPRVQRLQMKRAADGKRPRRHQARPRPLTVRLLPQPAPPKPSPPPPMTLAKTPALARLQQGAGHATPLEGVLEMDRGYGFAPTPLEGVPERFTAPQSAPPVSARLAALRGVTAETAEAASDGGSAATAATPALLEGRNCAPTPTLVARQGEQGSSLATNGSTCPTTGPTTGLASGRSRSSRSSSGSPMDGFLLLPATSAAGGSCKTGGGGKTGMTQGRSRFAASAAADRAAAAASAAGAALGSPSDASADDDTFSFGVKQAPDTAGCSSSGEGAH